MENESIFLLYNKISDKKGKQWEKHANKIIEDSNKSKVIAYLSILAYLILFTVSLSFILFMVS